MIFEDILENKPEEMKGIALQVRSLILKTDKRIAEGVYGGEKVRMSLYSIGGDTNVLYGMGVDKDHIKLYLHHTNKPDVDVAGLKLEGRGKHAKHVKIRTVDEDTKEQLSTAFESILEASGY